MTNNLIGKRVRATLGENVLVGTVTDFNYIDMMAYLKISEGAHKYDYIIGAVAWTIEPLPDPLPTAPYSLVVPPAEDCYTESSFILEPDDGSVTWYQEGSLREMKQVQQAIANGWRVIPGPAD